MHCSSVVNVVERGEITFKNKNDTYCLSSKTFHWFNSTEKIALIQVENLQNVILFHNESQLSTISMLLCS